MTILIGYCRCKICSNKRKYVKDYRDMLKGETRLLITTFNDTTDSLPVDTTAFKKCHKCTQWMTKTQPHCGFCGEKTGYSHPKNLD